MTFEELLREYHIEIAPHSHHHAREGWLQFDCPFCGIHTHKYHMGYNKQHKYVNCWRCGSHSLLATLIALTRRPRNEILKLIPHLESEQLERRREIKSKLVYPQGVQTETLLRIHKAYLKSRGFIPQRLQTLWHLGSLGGLALNLPWRIFIPIIHHDCVVSWTTRYIGKNPEIVRYIGAAANEEAIPKNELLYGEDYARHAIIIVEGVTDVWRIGPGAVATLSTNYTTAQVKRMSEYPLRTICFDRELEAQSRAVKLYEQLSCFAGETQRVLLDAKDPASANEHEIKQLKKYAGLE